MPRPDTNPHAPYSAPGSTSSGQCSVTPIAGYSNTASCSVSTNGDGKDVCRTSPKISLLSLVVSPDFVAAATSNGAAPNSTPINRKRDLKCARGHKRCPLYSGFGGYDCVNTRTDPENCGGCVSIDGMQSNDADSGPAGMDCTAIPDISMVQCVKSQCVIRKSFSQFLEYLSLTDHFHIARFVPKGLQKVARRAKLRQDCRCRQHHATATTSPSVPSLVCSWQVEFTSFSWFTGRSSSVISFNSGPFVRPLRFRNTL